MGSKSRPFSSLARLLFLQKPSPSVPSSSSSLRRPDSVGFRRYMAAAGAPRGPPRINQVPGAGGESESEADDDERFRPDAVKRKQGVYNRKLGRHKELLSSFQDAETFDEAYKLMKKIDKFEETHFPLRLEYRVIGELMNRLKAAETLKERFILEQKINRALRLVQWKEANDPNDPENYTKIQTKAWSHLADDEPERGVQGGEAAESDSEAEEEFNDMKEKDDILVAKINAIDKELEEKLAELDHTFGRRGKLLEEEIKALAEERNTLTEKKRAPLQRKGFDMKVIDVNRTNKITKGGRISKFSAIVVCGNYNGVIGFAKAKGPSVPVAVQKAREKAFQNLHYIERYEEHTIAHAITLTYKKTKLYLWPAPTRTGLVAGRKNTQIILSLAGFKNVKSKVIGSHNPYNTIKLVFMALNAIETPKDVQEKFGRTVVERYLL